MAALTHLAVGLAAKPAAPKIPLAVLIVGAYTIDFIWGLFYLTGVERLPEPGVDATNAWSHSLLMAVIWSLLAGTLAWLVSRNWRITVVMGLLVFSHWLIDFISHPMTAVFPDDTGLPLFFGDSPLVGLGVWRTQLGVNIGEYGTLIIGFVIYIATIVYLRKKQTANRQLDS